MKKIIKPILPKSFIALIKKEMAVYFFSPIAYIFLTVFLVVGHWLFFNTFFLIGEASLRSYFNFLPWILLFLASALSMRLWAEEKKTGTIEFLLTMPVTDINVVLAKFFSSWFFLAIALLLTIGLPSTVSSLGNLDFGPVIGSYLGAWLLGGFYLSVGLVTSSSTKNQIVAFISALVLSFIFLMFNNQLILLKLPILIREILFFIGPLSHYENFTRGIIDSRDLIYFFSFLLFMLWLNARIIALRK